MTPARAESVISCANDQAVWPWQSEPYRLWSLLEMIEQFPLSSFGSYLVDFERAMAGFEMILRPPKNEEERLSFSRLGVESFKKTLDGMTSAVSDGSVPLSHAVRMQVKDFIARLMTGSHTDPSAMLEHARLTRQAILNDLSQHLFLYVGYDVAGFYQEPLEGWEKAIDRFGCAFDIEEGRKCFALGRYTAAVFHWMKVVEAAVLELQMFLRDKDIKAHFGSVLSKLEHMTQQTKYEHVPAELQPYLQFMREVLTQLHAVKDSWRNKVSHVDARIVPTDTFTPELAKSVHDATLVLMNKLASGMPPKATA